jgi:hypothetical protein
MRKVRAKMLRRWSKERKDPGAYKKLKTEWSRMSAPQRQEAAAEMKRRGIC